jgi:hypothetical protein
LSSVEASAAASPLIPASGIEAHIPRAVLQVLPGQSESVRQAAHL